MRLEADPLTSFADSKLDRSTDDPTLGRAFGLTFPNEEPAFGTKAIAALVAYKAAIVPLAADGGDDDVIQDRLLTA